MKQIFTFLAFVISLGAFAQNSNLIVFNNGGQQFFVILNGIKQNSIPKTNVKIEGLAPIAYKVKIIFADGRTGDIDKNIYLDANMEYSAQIVIKNPKKRKLRLFDMVALNTSPYGNGSETVTYRPNDGATYSDQQGAAQVNGTQNAGGQVQNGTATATGTAQVNSGNVNQGGTAAIQANGSGQAGTAQSGVNMNGTTPSGNGTVQANVNVNGMPNGTATVTTSGNLGTTSQTGNVQVNGDPMNYSQSTVINPDGSQTITTTINGQTTTVTTHVSDMNGQASIGMNGMPMNGTQTVTTNVNGQSSTVTTSVSGNGMNGTANVSGNGMNGTQTTTTTVNGQTTQVTTTGTHVHADGTVHDHNHNPITKAPSASTHVHADGTVHNEKHEVVNNGQTHVHADGTVHDHNHNPVNTKNPRQPSALGDAVVNPNGSLTCNSALPSVDNLIAGIKEAKFSSDQMDLVKTELRSKCINSDQAYKIVNAFTFDGDKIAMSKFCYDHMTDKNNASKLLKLFQFSSSQDELKKYFGI